MSLPPTLENVRNAPGMFFRANEYDVAVAFIDGFNLASDGGLLYGFREWLIVRLNDGNNFAWHELVLRILFRDSRNPKNELNESDDHRWAIDEMFRLIQEFRHDRETEAGIRQIFRRYEEWLRMQDWYDETSPSWIVPRN